MTFNDLKIGQKASVQKTFTAADVTAFAGISLDVNPIHMSDKFAEGTHFQGCQFGNRCRCGSHYERTQ